RGAAGNPRRCLADHAGVLGDASWMNPLAGADPWASDDSAATAPNRSLLRPLAAAVPTGYPGGVLAFRGSARPLPAARLRVAPAAHHRGDDGDAHGGAGGEHAADGGAGSTGRPPV